VLRLEARAEPSKALSLASPLIALVLTALIAAALFVLLGKDPVRGLAIFFVEPLNGLRALSEVALKATPLILCALGLAICYRSNVWNIGAEGQLLLGAVAGGGMALWLGSLGLDAGRGALSPLVLLAGVASTPARSWSA
jgi:general nucleoside transport system permease protein